MVIKPFFKKDKSYNCTILSTILCIKFLSKIQVWQGKSNLKFQILHFRGQQTVAKSRSLKLDSHSLVYGLSPKAALCKHSRHCMSSYLFMCGSPYFACGKPVTSPLHMHTRVNRSALCSMLLFQQGKTASVQRKSI